MINTSARSGAEVGFRSPDGRQIGRLLLVAQSDDPQSLIVLDPSESRAYGEEPVQLREGEVYAYELLEAPEDCRLREDAIVQRFAIRNVGEREKGTIRPGPHTGLLTLVLEGPDERPRARAFVEVRSAKLGYRTEYRRMLDFIAGRAIELLLRLRAPAQVRLLPASYRSVETLQQQFFFMRSLLDSREFHEAIGQILERPHRRLVSFRTEQDVRKGVGPGKTSLTDIARSGRRVRIPPSHPLYERMKSHEIHVPSLPGSITEDARIDTLDTPENRFVKYALGTFEDFLLGLERRLQAAGPEFAVFATREVAPYREMLSEVLSREIFREISNLDRFPGTSTVLQARAGYREMLQIWLRFFIAAELAWSGGNHVYGGGKRDIATLYEYWLFFKLADMLVSEFHFLPPMHDQLFQTDRGLELRLKRGSLLELQGFRVNHKGFSLRMQFCYNRRFPGVPEGLETNYPSPGSWTSPMQPDFSFAFWPDGLSLDIAEERDQVVYIHFDAKYSVQAFRDLFGAADDDLDLEKVEQRQGTYKRADLLKMHAYKDAIRRSVGAYVLYPGEVSRHWREYHEIVPGLGAFVVRPGDREDEHVENIRRFLLDVLDEFTNRLRTTPP